MTMYLIGCLLAALCFVLTMYTEGYMASGNYGLTNFEGCYNIVVLVGFTFAVVCSWLSVIFFVCMLMYLWIGCLLR